MKELSIEEKAKAYDKAIKVIKYNLDALNKITETGTEVANIQPIKNWFYRAFPELKESEDERIRKELICFLETEIPHCNARDKYIAWLEKQGDKDSFIEKELECIKGYRENAIKRLKELEKKGKQKLTEFEKAVKQVMEEAIECGDTHNLKADADMLLSLIQKPDEEYNITGIHSKHAKGKLGEMIKNLKSINEKQCEKPRYSIGDILCDKSCTTLNKDAQPNFEILDIRNGLYICDNGFIPISQQDEYELVAKKIEQKPSIEKLPEEMKTIGESLGFTTQEECDNYNQMVTDLIMADDDKIDHNSSWSEEDKNIIEDAACVILDCINTAETEKEKKRLEELFNKLQDLKPQKQWKPSEEQIEILDMVLTNESMDDNIARILRELREQLKKLKE